MMDGNLELHSDIGRETKFSFAIPVEYGSGADIASSQLARRVIGLEAGQAPFRLLVVEDSKNNRNLLVRLLRTVGFEVQEAVNGQDAIELWEKWHPHLIWMDIRMPAMDGYEATTHIKTSPGSEDTVIIALTASAFEEDRRKIIEHGGNDFVRKPFRESEIFEMLEKHLGVKFVYGEDTSHKLQAGQQISAEDLKCKAAALPIEILARLVESTELSDAAMIDQAIKDIRINNVGLADALSGLAENFAYDKILAIVQEAKEMIDGKQGR
jgi:CheY-like chemotaxis protein